MGMDGNYRIVEVNDGIFEVQKEFEQYKYVKRLFRSDKKVYSHSEWISCDYKGRVPSMMNNYKKQIYITIEDAIEGLRKIKLYPRVVGF